MKKYFSLLAVLLSFISCSVSDEKEPGEEILGNWFLIDSNHPEIYDPEACSSSTTVSFQEEGVAEVDYHDQECNIVNFTGSWEYLQDDQFSIELLPELGTTEGRLFFEAVHVFKFSTKVGDETLVLTFER